MFAIKSRLVDGLLIIDKPAGFTSHDVVNRLRRILGTRRVGHTGTLDPFATGVMVMLIGKATRLAQFLDKDDKEYEATIRFGFETDTGDVTGSPKSSAPSTSSVSLDKVAAVLPQFTGQIEQVPPMYSAKKIGGKKLYESARKGVEIEREPIRVTINSLEILPSPESDTVCIRVACSAGTYIRTLAEDIGRAVGVGAHLTQLRRARSGRFDLSGATTLDGLAEFSETSDVVLPIDQAVDHLAEFILAADRVDPTKKGLSTREADTAFVDRQNVRMLSPEGELIAIGRFLQEESSIKPRIVLV
ncbi:MAG: tRNA pseudouridine(55) synthase TruB [Acidobacteria bacterium]|nr:tRNA pseudouridine(55) synthase TruB [Acidobacteriota bacterium]